MADETRRGDEVLVVGTGAMASLFAGYLARSGRTRVTMAGRWHEGLAALREHGVTVEDASATWSAPVCVLARNVPTDPLPDATLAARHRPLHDAEPSHVLWALVLVKSHQTAAAAGWLRRFLAADGVAISLQNGLGNDRRLARSLGWRRVAVGVTDCGATLLGPGRVRVGGLGMTVLEAGSGRGRAGAGVAPIVHLLSSAGLECEIVDDIRPAVWRKLAVNCAVNPNAALRSVPNGALLHDPQALASMERAAREVGAVAQAIGVSLDGDPAAAAIAVAQRTALNWCSMLQDLDRRAPTEIDALNGAIVRLGRRHGVPTPENERLWRAVRAATAATGGREARSEWPAVVRAAAPADGAPARRAAVSTGPQADGAPVRRAAPPPRLSRGGMA